MKITSNLTSVIGDLLGKFELLGNPDTITRAVATAMMPTIRKRIHVEGLNSNSGKIGVYDNAYLKLRKKKYNRTADSDVVISLTRQLENSYVLGAAQNSYNISFSTPLSFDKATWMEEKYGKIWDLTIQEEEQAYLVASNETQIILE